MNDPLAAPLIKANHRNVFGSGNLYALVLIPV